MTLEIAITLSIIALAIYLFIRETFSIDTISILIMVTFMVTGILTPEEGFSGFNNTATITVGAMFVLSAAIFKSGALNKVTLLLSKSGKTNYYLLLIVIMGITGIMSAFINDTAVVAMFLPVVLKVAHDSGIAPSRLLMPLSFGSLMGGICTLVGTSTNILVSGIAANHGLEPFGMFELTKAGLWFLAAGILYMVTIGSWLMPKHPPGKGLAESYNMDNYIAEVKLLPDFKDNGKSIDDSGFVQENDLEILKIIRNDKAFQPFPSFILLSGDILKLRCNIDDLKKLESGKKVEIVQSGETLLKEEEDQKGEMQLLEVLITPDSRYSGKSIRALRHWQAFSNAPVLAIRSRNEIVNEKLTEVLLKNGDILLLRVNAEQHQSIKENGNFLILSETENTSVELKRAIPTLAIVTMAIVSAALGWLPIVLSASLAALVLIVLRFISPEEAYNSIHWKVIFMLAGVLSMGLALEKTGAASILGIFITDTLGQFGPRVLVSAFFFITFMATNIMSNNASAALLAPIAIVTAQSMGISERPLLMAVTFAASLSFMTPMGYQTNTMIYGPGNYRFVDYLRVGTPLNLLLWLIATFTIPYYFPF
jgi:di/tricarboxylate transporter